MGLTRHLVSARRSGGCGAATLRNPTTGRHENECFHSRHVLRYPFVRSGSQPPASGNQQSPAGSDQQGSAVCVSCESVQHVRMPLCPTRGPTRGTRTCRPESPASRSTTAHYVRGFAPTITDLGKKSHRLVAKLLRGQRLIGRSSLAK